MLLVLLTIGILSVSAAPIPFGNGTKFDWTPKIKEGTPGSWGQVNQVFHGFTASQPAAGWPKSNQAKIISPGMYAFGKLANNASDAWLISPPQDLTAYTNPKFSTWWYVTGKGYNMTPDTQTEILWSSDYTDDPWSATWTNLNADDTMTAATWIQGILDLSAAKDMTISVAYHFVSAWPVTIKFAYAAIDDYVIPKTDGSASPVALSTHSWDLSSVNGTANWEIADKDVNGTTMAAATLDASAGLVDDYLISPPVDMSMITEPHLSFWMYYALGDTNAPSDSQTGLFYTEAYDSGADPRDVNWTSIDYDMAIGDKTWKQFTIPVEDVAGKPRVTFAFATKTEKSISVSVSGISVSEGVPSTQAGGNNGTTAAGGDDGTTAAGGDDGTTAAGDGGTTAAGGDDGTTAAGGDDGTTADGGDANASSGVKAGLAMVALIAASVIA